MPADPRLSNLFADKENGFVKRVEKVDPSYVQITVLKPLPSTFSLATSEYDTNFMARHNVIDAGSMRLPETYRPPANWAEFWHDPAEGDAVPVAITEPATLVDPEPDLNATRSETAEGVTIGAPAEGDEPPHGALGM